MNMPDNSSQTADSVLPIRTRRSRPFGIYVISLLLFISALLLAASLVALEFVEQYIPPFASDSLIFIAGAWLLVAAVILAIIGLLLLKRWGWTLTMILTGLSLANNIWLYFQGEPDYPNTVIFVVIVFYLNQREVQTPFFTQDELDERHE